MVRCYDCGLYAVRRASDQELHCVPERMRVEWEEGNPWVQVAPGVRSIPLGTARHVFEDLAICGAGAFEFPWGGDFVRISREERECASFVKWIPALTPAEHKAVLDEQWKREQERQDREWRTKQEKLDRIWRAGELFLILAVTIIAAVVGALLTNGGS